MDPLRSGDTGRGGDCGYTQPVGNDGRVSDQSAPSRRSGPSAADLLRSLLPLTVLILVMVWLYRPADTDPVREIDPGPTVSYAASIADFQVLAAVDLPAGWRATSARAEPASEGEPVGLTVGYVTPTDRFAEVVQSSVPQPQLLLDVLGEGYTEADLTVEDGHGYQTADGELALVLAESGSTIVITGSADVDELRVLAAALRPAGG